MREWGKKFINRRNWREYNEQLVVGRELYLDISFRDEWFMELGKMDYSKREDSSSFPNRL
ncbi:MAG: hypothetical protein QW752_05505 [Thermoplasmata archaeon]